MNPLPSPQRFLGIGNLLLFGGAFVLIASASDAAAYPEHFVGLLMVRLAWGGTYLGLGLWARRGSPSGQRWVSSIITAVTPAFFGLFLLQLGTDHTGAFPWLLALPFLLVVFLRSTPLGAAAGGAMTLVVALVLVQRLGSSTSELWQWGSSVAAAGVMSVYAAWHQGRLYAAIEANNQARLQALSTVVDSERRSAVNERLVLVGQLAAGVAHEVNNPLAAVSSNLSYLAEQPASEGGDLREVLADTRAGVQRISTIVRALKAYAQETSGEVCAVDCRRVLEASAQLAATRAQPGQLHTELSAELPQVMVNEPRLMESLVGVLGNALEATGATTGSAQAAVWLRARVEHGRVLVLVEDDGPGFPPQMLARIATPFFTTKPPGSGLGLSLAVARQYLERMGATIQFANRDGGGARVSMTLLPAPVVDPRA